MNILKPGAVKKIHHVASGPMKQFRDMENIGNFLSAIEQYGVVKVDQFQTANLTDRKNNMAMVINTIHALGRAVSSTSFVYYSQNHITVSNQLLSSSRCNLLASLQSSYQLCSSICGLSCFKSSKCDRKFRVLTKKCFSISN